MTLENLYQILAGTNLPTAYLAFPEDSDVSMPFIVYQEVGSDNFGADNIVWHSATKIQVDLMTQKKDRALEELLESVFNANGIYWERVPDYDEGNDYYRITYEIEI